MCPAGVSVGHCSLCSPPSCPRQLLNKGSEHFSYPCTPTTMLPRSAYWHHITGSQNMAESSSYTGEHLPVPCWGPVAPPAPACSLGKTTLCFIPRGGVCGRPDQLGHQPPQQVHLAEAKALQQRPAGEQGVQIIPVTQWCGDRGCSGTCEGSAGSHPGAL